MTSGTEAVERAHDLLAELLREFGVTNAVTTSDPETTTDLDVVATGSPTAG